MIIIRKTDIKIMMRIAWYKWIKIMLIFGTRPEAIKDVSLVAELKIKGSKQRFVLVSASSNVRPGFYPFCRETGLLT